jgi:hypothetical protein
VGRQLCMDPGKIQHGSDLPHAVIGRHNLIEAKRIEQLVCIPDPVPGVRSESGYFRSLERRCGDGTEGEVDGGDHPLPA